MKPISEKLGRIDVPFAILWKPAPVTFA